MYFNKCHLKIPNFGKFNLNFDRISYSRTIRAQNFKIIKSVKLNTKELNDTNMLKNETKPMVFI